MESMRCLTDSPVLQISNVSKAFNEVTALDDVSFSVGRCEVVGLLGTNGSGKTTLFNVISRLLSPDEGSLRLNDCDLLRLEPQRLAAAGIARIFQVPQLCPTLSVFDNVYVAAHYKALGKWKILARERDVLRKTVFETLEALKLTGIGSLFPHQISLFEQRKVELARAWAAVPKLMLLDEISSGLASGEKDALIALLRRIFVGHTAMLLIEHDIAFVHSICNRVVVLNAGRKIAEQTISNVGSGICSTGLFADALPC